MKTLILAALLVVAAHAQEQKLASICGMNHKTPDADIQLIQVSCLDFGQLIKLVPGVAWPTTPVTQVLVHVRAGDRVYISVDSGKTYRRQKLVRDATGRLVALVQFEGIEHSALDVDVVPAEAQ